jgi:hypothetical protein
MFLFSAFNLFMQILVFVLKRLKLFFHRFYLLFSNLEICFNRTQSYMCATALKNLNFKLFVGLSKLLDSLDQFIFVLVVLVDHLLESKIIALFSSFGEVFPLCFFGQHRVSHIFLVLLCEFNLLHEALVLALDGLNRHILGKHLLSKLLLLPRECRKLFKSIVSFIRETFHFVFDLYELWMVLQTSRLSLLELFF